MQRAAQILTGLLALFLVYLSIRYIFTPDALVSFNMLTPDGNFGLSNFRAQAAPMLTIAILAAIAAVKEDWKFITPAALYFLMLILIRIYSLIADGSDPGTIRALVLAAVFFAVSEFAVQVFKKSERRQAEG